MSVDLIHIGLHKSASTYLQEEGFASHPQIRAVTWRNSPDVNWLLTSLVRGYLSYRKQDLQNYFEAVRSDIEPKQKVVLSFEGLSGGMHSGENSRNNAEQLRDAFGPTKILLILREPYSYILSCWCHYVYDGGCLPLSKFLNSPTSPTLTNGRFQTDEPQGLFGKLLYDRYVEFLFELFGKDNVHVLFFEDLCSDSSRFMRRVYRAAGVDEGHIPNSDVIIPSKQKVGPSQARWLRILNYYSPTLHSQPFLKLMNSSWRRRAISWLNRRVPHRKPDLDALLHDDVKHRIQESNRALGQLLDEDLEQRGYDCGQPRRQAA